MFGSETAINIYDLVKSEIEYDDTMRCPKKTISQLFSSRTTYNLGTAYYHEGKKLLNILIISYFMSFFTDIGGISSQNLHKVRCYYIGKRAVVFTHYCTSIYISND